MDFVWTWTWDPVVVAALVVTAGLYARGWRRMERGGSWRAPCFAAGWLAVVLALVSPIDEIASQLFSVHMVQHELLMIVAAPLLVLGGPGIVFLQALPVGWRPRIVAWPHRVGVDGAWRAITGPVAVWVLHGAALWLWHLPSLYQAAVADETVHAVEHLCFFGTAVLFWRALVHGRYGRLGYGVSVLYVFTTAVHTGLLGALLTISPRVWYPIYATSVQRWGLTALEDQQLAGLVMWVPAGVLFTVLGLGLFAAWLAESERRVAYTQSERLSRGSLEEGAR